MMLSIIVKRLLQQDRQEMMWLGLGGRAHGEKWLDCICFNDAANLIC